jgi:AraC family transcriptional regulator
MREDNLDRWMDRIGRAADLLTTRLDDPPSLDELAGAAAVSPFHFHRIWRGLTGETVAGTVARLRIERASQALATAAPITEVAMAAGFGTPQSFARAFRRETGVTPSAFRAGEPPRAAADDRATALVRLVLRDATTLVALRREGQPYADLNASFGAVWQWAEQAGLIDRLGGIYGLPLDDPASVPVERLRYDAALDVGPATPPPPFATVMLAAGEYACVRHVGGYDGLEAIDQYLLGDWLLHAAREPADASLVHHFLDDPEQVAEADLRTDILLPLMPEGAGR